MRMQTILALIGELFAAIATSGMGKKKTKIELKTIVTQPFLYGMAYFTSRRSFN